MKQYALAALLTASIAVPSAHAQRLVPPSNVPQVVQQAQAAQSYQVIELEEKVRTLNGKVEELNFLLLQLQEKFRKMEEDNEGRFQEIEEKLSEVGNSSTNKLAKSNPDTKRDGEPRLGKPKASETKTVLDVKPRKKEAAPVETPKRGEPPRALGTLVFDKDGNVIDGATGSQSGPKINPFGTGSEGSVEASEFGATPNEVLKAGKQAFEARNYEKAQQIFSAHIKAWPKDIQTGVARHFAAESLFWQKQYYQAAEAHLETHNQFPEAETAADNLLGLGLSLAGLNQREVACATYAEVLKQYPDAAKRLGNRIKDEQAAARC